MGLSPRDEDRLRALRSRYIDANERVARLYTRGAPRDAIRRAERDRDRAGDAWYHAAQRAATETRR